MDEVLKINLSDAKFGIKYLAIIICSHNGHSLSNVESASLEVKCNSKVILSSSVGGQGNCISFLPCIFSK